MKDSQRILITGLFMGALLAVSIGLGYLAEFFINLDWIVLGFITYGLHLTWSLGIIVFCFRLLWFSFKGDK